MTPTRPDRALSTTASSSTRQRWRAAVVAVAETIQATLPPCNGRLERAVALALEGHVDLHAGGVAMVVSQHEPTTRYTVNGQCNCPDASTAPQGWCKHRLAAQIARQAQLLMQSGKPTSIATLPHSSRVAIPKENAMTRQYVRDNDETAIQDAIEQAERACQEAVSMTPAVYRGFLRFIRQNKKVAGTSSHPVYAAIRLPYMGVDGRVKMAIDDHRQQQGTLSIETQFETEPVTGQLVCKATVASSLFGSVTAHARVFINGKGVDATNPLENAETSAIGRALGFMGFGLLGSGVASAEEILQAGAAQVSPQSASEADTPEPPISDAVDAKPPSDRQHAYLRDLLGRTGVAEAEVSTRLAGVTTSQEASTLINQLRAQLREPAA